MNFIESIDVIMFTSCKLMSLEQRREVFDLHANCVEILELPKDAKTFSDP